MTEEMTRDYMMTRLQQSECRVIFKKTNGEERDMICTLQPDIIPDAKKEDPLSQKKVRSINEEVISVWDTEVEAWRSFRVDRVISFSCR